MKGSVKQGNQDRGLANRFRDRTHALHRQAERSGIIQDILRARVTRFKYAVFLRNLLAAYHQLELGLDYHRTSPGVRLVAQPMVYRSASLEADLKAMYGSDWRQRLPLLPSGRIYRRRVAEAAIGGGERLIAHAYTRYLGDLNGGQVLKRRLSEAMGLGAASLSFYDFADIDDLGDARTRYRAAIDQSASEIPDIGEVVEEAARAFQLNIAVSEDVRALPDLTVCP